MSKEYTKSQAEETKAKAAPFAECMEQMMSSCGPQMKKWMAACVRYELKLLKRSNHSSTIATPIHCQQIPPRV
jgi:hypothetical protein